MVDKRDEADKLIDELIKGKTPEVIVGKGGLLYVPGCKERKVHLLPLYRILGTVQEFSV